MASLMRRCAARSGVELQRRATKAGIRHISSKLRMEEYKAMQAERLVMLGADERQQPPSGQKLSALLASAPLDTLSPAMLFRATDVADLLESPDALVNLIVARTQSATKQIDDKWCAQFILQLYHATKRFESSIIPSKTTVQVLKVFRNKEKTNNAFAPGTEAANAVLTTLYSEKVDVGSLFQFYSRYKQWDIAPDQNTLAMMFNVSLRGQRMKNAENFFAACEKLLMRADLSYTPKADIVNTLALGFHDTYNADYTLRLIKLLEKACFACQHIPTLPQKIAARKSEHLYLDPLIAERLFWGAYRTRNAALLKECLRWMEFFENQGTTLPIRPYMSLMRICSSNSDHGKAFELFDKMCNMFEENVLKGYSQSLKQTCMTVLEGAARSRRDQNLERSREMMEAMISKGILSSDSDKAELYVMQIRLLASSNDFRKAKELYDKVKRACSADVRLITVMLRSPFAKENLDILREVYNDWMGMVASYKVKPEHVTEVHERYIGCLADSGELGEVLRVMETLEGKGSITVSTVEQVLKACARDKDATSYGTFYKWSEGGQDDMPLYFSHLKNNRTTVKNCEVARGVFDKLAELGVQPTVKTYNLLMAVYSAARDYDEVARLYNVVKEDKALHPTQHTYYYMAKAHAERGSVDMVETVMSELLTEVSKTDEKVKDGKKRDDKDSTFNADIAAQAIRALQNTGMRIETVAYMRNITPGDEELDWMDEQPSKIIPTRQPRKAEVDMGFKIVEALNELGLVPGHRVYTALLGLCTRAGDYERADDVYKMLKQDGSSSYHDKSDIVTNLMKMHYTRDNMAGALAFLEEVRATDTYALDATAYHNCMAVCANNGNIHGCKEVLTAMFEDGHICVSDTAIALALTACAYHKPGDGEEDYNMVAKAKEILNEYREMHKLHREKVPVVNSQHIFHKLLFVCAEARNADEARAFIQEMKDNQIMVDKTAMLLLARSLRSVDDLPSFWAQMERERIEPDTGVIFRLLQVCQSSRDAMVALDIVVKYPALCNEKLHLMFYRIVEKARLSEGDYQNCNERFYEAFGRDLKEIKELANRRALEQTQQAVQTDATQISAETDNVDEMLALDDDDDTAPMSF